MVVQVAIVHTNAIELYAEAFDQVGKLEAPRGFCQPLFGADFYGLPRNTSTITLVREKIP